MKIFSYWERSKYSSSVPPYVLLGIASMKYFLKENFILLTKSNVEEFLSFEFKDKHFFFAASPDKKKNETSHLTAKSDFIRFRFIQKNGGFWLDADTIVLDDFSAVVEDWLSKHNLAWHSEAMFGACKGNQIIENVVDNCLRSERMTFANPGNVKDTLRDNKENFFSIPYQFFTPSSSFDYSAKTWSLMFRTDISAGDFLSARPSVLKLYNSNISADTDFSEMSVRDFLDHGSLLPNIFLHINPDVEFWVNEADKIFDSIG